MTDVFPGSEEALRDFALNPYSTFQRLRGRASACWTERGALMLLSYGSVNHWWRDHKLSVERPGAYAVGAVDARGSAAMLNRESPIHTVLRSVVDRSVRTRVLGLDDHVRGCSRQLLNQIDRKSFDLVDEYASPLVFDSLCFLLGIPSSHACILQRYCATLVDDVDSWWVLVLGSPSPKDVGANSSSVEHAGNEARTLLQALFDAPLDEDSAIAQLSGMPNLSHNIGRLELLEQVLLLLMAGPSPAANLISNSIAEIAVSPDLYQHLRESPHDVSAAVTETLRLESPIQFSRRYATKRFSIDSHELRIGDQVLFAIGSANRDEEHWGDDASKFRLWRRNSSRHVAFGRGVHFCFGASIAERITCIALEHLVEAIPWPQATCRTQLSERLNVRGYRHFHVET